MKAFILVTLLVLSQGCLARPGKGQCEDFPVQDQFEPEKVGFWKSFFKRSKIHTWICNFISSVPWEVVWVLQIFCHLWTVWDMHERCLFQPDSPWWRQPGNWSSQHGQRQNVRTPVISMLACNKNIAQHLSNTGVATWQAFVELQCLPTLLTCPRVPTWLSTSTRCHSNKTQQTTVWWRQTTSAILWCTLVKMAWHQTRLLSICGFWQGSNFLKKNWSHQFMRAWRHMDSTQNICGRQSRQIVPNFLIID